MDIEFLSQNWYLIAGMAFILGIILLEPLLLKASGIGQINSLSVTQLVNHKSAVIVDVSSEKEYQIAHIPDAINLPLSGLASGSDKLEKLKDNPVIISCRSGARAKTASKKLRKLGLTELYILTGGNMAWEKENLPMKRG